MQNGRGDVGGGVIYGGHLCTAGPFDSQLVRGACLGNRAQVALPTDHKEAAGGQTGREGGRLDSQGPISAHYSFELVRSIPGGPTRG